METVGDVHHDRSNGALELGYFVTPSLGVRFLAGGFYTHGGLVFNQPADYGTPYGRRKIRFSCTTTSSATIPPLSLGGGLSYAADGLGGCVRELSAYGPGARRAQDRPRDCLWCELGLLAAAGGAASVRTEESGRGAAGPAVKSVPPQRSALLRSSLSPRRLSRSISAVSLPTFAFERSTGRKSRSLMPRKIIEPSSFCFSRRSARIPTTTTICSGTSPPSSTRRESSSWESIPAGSRPPRRSGRTLASTGTRSRSRKILRLTSRVCSARAARPRSSCSITKANSVTTVASLRRSPHPT